MDKIDFASAPLLTVIRAAAGDDAVLALVRQAGGTSIHLPKRAEGSRLARIVGLPAARAIMAAIGCKNKRAIRRDICIPTGRGLGRRIDHSQVLDLAEAGISNPAIARTMGCTTRHVQQILKDKWVGRSQPRSRKWVRPASTVSTAPERPAPTAPSGSPDQGVSRS